MHPAFSRCLLAAATILVGNTPSVAAMTDAMPHARIAEVYSSLPLTFEANAGQLDKQVRFLSRAHGNTLFLTANEAALHLGDQKHGSSVVRMAWAGGNRHPRVLGETLLATKSNYLLGNDPGVWHTGVSHYASVRYVSVYPGIDLVFRGNQRQLEYDFLLAPNADPRRIRLAFQGADQVTLGPEGELLLHTEHGDLVQPAPKLYQEETPGRRHLVEGHYVLLTTAHRKAAGSPIAPQQVGFVTGRYDRTRPLIIDPAVQFSTYLGGLAFDEGDAIAVDRAGNTYITGYTQSTTFPGVSGSSIQATFGGGNTDTFVTKIDAAGTAIIYSTFLGGSNNDTAFAIAVDGAGDAYVAGGTQSSDFPGMNASSIQPTFGGGEDAFVTKINAAGTAIVYSTFLGGSGTDLAFGIAVDGAGNAYVTGLTNSLTFPGVSLSSIQPAFAGGAFDAFVTKINSAGTAIVYSTFLGSINDDYGQGIAVDGAGNAYLTGYTNSAAFPGVSGSSIQPVFAGGTYDAFVTKINSTGTAIVYSTFLGGSGDDRAFGVAVDGAGNAYVTGWTGSPTFPGVNASSIQPAFGGGGYDAFVTKINSTGTATTYSTFLGGASEDQGFGIAVDGAGNAYVIGDTSSIDFPGMNSNSIQPTKNGGDGNDVFVTKINSTGTAIAFSTYLGGSGDDHGLAIAVDGVGNPYITGYTNSLGFTGVTSHSLQPTGGGNGDYDAFVMKINFSATGPLDFYTLAPCRLVDTRQAPGSLGGPALQPGAMRTFALAGTCGIPSLARAASVNVTVAGSSAAGFLSLWSSDEAQPNSSTINYRGGDVRANNAIVGLSADGEGAVLVFTGSSSSVQFILDVNGYFQ